ncbi:endonuclease SmrB [Buchnera aphidicola (Aphis helianthi)]|uniref:Ribosome rescue factor SmrB n=1 Tax=Buchnera aphidicola (Aphis helianthi) TaxID=2315802 RepID=A0A4D6XKE2_9GAMM|nr:endonuclease SmrB [Buchnera aphidicola]QCI16933.1 endonuclease SmrB [Buchnera aphidicola (Aphis helianthi)]
MNKNREYSNNRNISFRQYLNDTREIVQDKIFHSRTSKVVNQNIISKRNIFEQEAHSYYFSCLQNEKIFFKENPVSYMRSKNSNNILKRLKKGKYSPDISLDLHGLTQYQAQKKLGQLITICQKEKIFCAHVIHGYGKNILKQQIPFWLSQHPDIVAFHQAPRVFGNDAAIIVIIEIYN